MPNLYCSQMDQDPEELLYNLGFGTEVSSPVDRIPSRFLHPSQVDGNDLDNFIVQQEELWETSSMHLNGYHGLAGYPTNGEQVHGIVGKIHEKIRERNRELKRSQRPSFLNAAFSVMAARAFRNLVRPPPPQPPVNPTSILDPQNRDFLERQEESIASRRRRRRPRLVLGKNSFVLDTDEELVDDELDAVDSDVGDGSAAGETRESVPGGSGSATKKDYDQSGGSVKRRDESRSLRVDTGSVHVDTIRKDKDCGSIKWGRRELCRDGSEGGGSVVVETGSGEKADPSINGVEAIAIRKQFMSDADGKTTREKCPVIENGFGKKCSTTGNGRGEKCPATGNGLDMVNDNRGRLTKTISKIDFTNSNEGKLTSVTNELGSTSNGHVHHAVTNDKIQSDTKAVSVVVDSKSTDPGEVFKLNDEQLSVPVRCDGSTKPDEVGKRWAWSVRSESQLLLGRVGSERVIGRPASGQFQYGRGWVRSGESSGWVPSGPGQSAVATVKRRNSLPTKLDGLVNGGVAAPLDRSAPSVEALRSHLRRQSGVDELPVELNERLDTTCTVESQSNGGCKTYSGQEKERLDQLESPKSPDCTSSKPPFKNGNGRPPLLASRAESGFESCDIDLRDEMDALDTTHSQHPSTVGGDDGASEYERVMCADPQHVVPFPSPSNDADKLSGQPRASLHREFLEKIRHRCRMTTDAPPTVDKSSLGSDAAVAPPVHDGEFPVKSTVGGPEVPSSDSATSQSSVNQDRNRLEEFHEGCVSAVDRMQKSMQLYVRRLRTMEQTWGDTYSRWFIASRKSEKRDLNQLASVHQSIMAEASQTQALLRDHSDAIDRAKRQSSCRTVDSQLVVCSSQLRTVAHDLDGIIREQDSMLRQMRQMEADVDVEDCESLSSGTTTTTLTSGDSVKEIASVNCTSIPLQMSTSLTGVSGTTSSLSTPRAYSELPVAVSTPVSPSGVAEVTEVTSQVTSANVQSSPSTDGIHKLLTKLKHEMTADIKSTIGEDCVRFEKDLKSTSQQMEDVKSFLSRMLSVIQTNK